MARSTVIYLVRDPALMIVAAFTVKHECMSWCERMFGLDVDGLHKPIWFLPDKHDVVRLPDKPNFEPYGGVGVCLGTVTEFVKAHRL